MNCLENEYIFINPHPYMQCPYMTGGRSSEGRKDGWVGAPKRNTPCTTTLCITTSDVHTEYRRLGCAPGTYVYTVHYSWYGQPINDCPLLRYRKVFADRR